MQLGQVNYGGDSPGVEMIEASRTEGLIDIPAQPILPPTPDFQVNQAGIQLAPEPSTFALLGFGMAAIFVGRRK